MLLLKMSDSIRRRQGSQNSSAKRRQRGIGLMELMLGVSIIALLIILATRYFQSVKRSQLISQTISDVTVIVSAANQWVSSFPDEGFVNLTFQALSDEGLLPPHLDSAAPKSAFGTTMSISAAASNTFTLGFTSGGPECTQMMNRLSKEPLLDPSCSAGNFSVIFTTTAKVVN